MVLAVEILGQRVHAEAVVAAQALAQRREGVVTIPGEAHRPPAGHAREHLDVVHEQVPVLDRSHRGPRARRGEGPHLGGEGVDGHVGARRVGRHPAHLRRRFTLVHRPAGRQQHGMLRPGQLGQAAHRGPQRAQHGLDLRLRVLQHRLDLHLDFGGTQRLVGPAFAPDDVVADEQILVLQADRLPDADVVLLEGRGRRADADHARQRLGDLLVVRGEVDARTRRGKRQEADQILGGHRADPLLRRSDNPAGVAGEAGLVDDQQDDAAVLLRLVRRDLGVAGRCRRVGRRRRVLDEIDRDDLARLAADLDLEVGRPQAADDDALAIEHGRLDHDDVGLRTEARRRHVRRLRLRGRRLG